MFVSYNELYSLIGGGHFSNYESWFKNNSSLIQAFVTATAKLSLVCTSVNEMSETTRAVKSIIFFAKGILKTNLLILNEVVTESNCLEIVDLYTNLLNTELGLNSSNEYYLRIIYQMNDSMKSKRIVFLLSRIRDIVFKYKSESLQKSEDYSGKMTTLMQTLLNLLYVCTSPNIVKVASQLVDLIYDQNIDFKQFETIFKNPIVYYHAQNK